VQRKVQRINNNRRWWTKSFLSYSCFKCFKIWVDAY